LVDRYIDRYTFRQIDRCRYRYIMEAHELDSPYTRQTVIGLKTQMDLLDKVHIYIYRYR